MMVIEIITFHGHSFGSLIFKDEDEEKETLIKIVQG